MRRDLSNKIAFTLLTLGFVIAPCVSFAEQRDVAQQSRPGADAELPSSPHDDTVADPFALIRSGVRTFSLTNGLRVVFFKRDHSPVFSAHLGVRVGGVNEDEGLTGLAHFLEHMAFKGTEVLGTKDYSRERPLLKQIEEHLAKSNDQQATLASSEVQKLFHQLDELVVDNEFGRLYSSVGSANLNAMTSKDSTVYVVSLPNVAFEFWNWMESERLLRPVFRQFYKEREVIKEERRRGYDDDPGGKLYEQLLDLSFVVHPYKVAGIGKKEDLGRPTATQMEEFYQRYYRPDNMVIGLVGDLDFEQVQKIVEKYFGRLERGKGEVPDVKVEEPVQDGERRRAVEFDAGSQILIGYHKPTYPNPEDAQLAVLHALLSDGRSSLLEKRFVRERKLAASIFTTEAPGERFPGLFIVGAVPMKGVRSELLRREIQRYFDGFDKVKITDSDLVAAKRRVQVGMLSALDSDSDLAAILAKGELFWGNWQQAFQIYETMSRTSKEDLRSLVRKYLRSDNSNFVWIEAPKGKKREEVRR